MYRLLVPAARMETDRYKTERGLRGFALLLFTFLPSASLLLLIRHYQLETHELTRYVSLVVAV